MSKQRSDYIVDYYGQKFELTQSQANALVNAVEDGLRVVQIDDLVLSTNFNWIAPISEVEADRLSGEELTLVSDIVQWIDRPVQGVDMTTRQIESYAKKTVKQLGSGRVRSLYEKYANDAYPLVTKFMSAVKQEREDLRIGEMASPAQLTDGD